MGGRRRKGGKRTGRGRKKGRGEQLTLAEYLLWANIFSVNLPGMDDMCILFQLCK